MSENMINTNAAGEGKIFRKAVNGFNRQDVMEYIERMARERLANGT